MAHVFREIRPESYGRRGQPDRSDRTHARRPDAVVDADRAEAHERTSSKLASKRGGRYHVGAASSRQARRSSLPSPAAVRRSDLRFGAVPSSVATPWHSAEDRPKEDRTDKLDAQVLAEFLARDMIPQAHRPTPRVREHRTLVRQRQFLKQSVTGLKNKMRRILSNSNYNADRKDLFTAAGWKQALKAVKISASDRFVLEQLHAGWKFLGGQIRDLTKHLKEFAAGAREAEARAKLGTIRGVGPVTIDVVVSELGDIDRFHSSKAVTAYAGLAPRVRQSAGKGKDLGITKEGSPLLRWALVEASWRVVNQSQAWTRIYQNIKKRAGSKKAIVAVARRLLGVMYAMLRDGKNYDLVKVGEPPPKGKAKLQPAQ
jgi:transposase